MFDWFMNLIDPAVREGKPSGTYRQRWVPKVPFWKRFLLGVGR